MAPLLGIDDAWISLHPDSVALEDAYRRASRRYGTDAAFSAWRDAHFDGNHYLEVHDGSRTSRRLNAGGSTISYRVPVSRLTSAEDAELEWVVILYDLFATWAERSGRLAPPRLTVAGSPRPLPPT